MNTFIAVLLSAMAIMLLCLAGLGVKTLLHRGELKRHCAGMDPYSGERTGCVCAKQHSEMCSDRQRHPYQPLDVNENLMRELRVEN